MDFCSQDAISLKCGRVTLKRAENSGDGGSEKVTAKRKRAGHIAWGIALAVLVFSLIWLNVIHPPRIPEAPEQNAAEMMEEDFADSAAAGTGENNEAVVPVEDSGDFASSAPVGYEEGSRLADFSTPLIGGGDFHLADYRGKIVFINLWATFCKPCIAELPYFNQLKDAHPDMEILAVHNGSFTREEEVVSFLADKDWNNIDFSLDDKDQSVFRVVNGSTAMPQTIVLNRKGEVIYNEKRSMTYEMLEELYQRADS